MNTTAEHVEAVYQMLRTASLFTDVDYTAVAHGLAERVDADLLGGLRILARTLGPAIQMCAAQAELYNANAPVRARPSVVPDDNGSADTTRRIERDADDEGN